jgi:glutathione S-transferase
MENPMIDFYTSTTPNRRKISIMLERLNFLTTHPPLGKFEQRQDWYLK